MKGSIQIFGMCSVRPGRRPTAAVPVERGVLTGRPATPAMARRCAGTGHTATVHRPLTMLAQASAAGVGSWAMVVALLIGWCFALASAILCAMVLR